MLSFRKFLIETFLLLENRLEFLKNKFKEISTEHDPDAEHKEPHAIINHFANADPHPTKANTQWVINQYRKGHIRQVDSQRVNQTLGNFERHKSRLTNRDINSYQHIDHVDQAVEPHLGALSNKEQKKQVKNDGADLIYKSPNMIVHKLKTKEAACKYGAGTRWCTAAREQNYFDRYNREGPLYVVNHKDGNKHQFHFESGQFADPEDRMHHASSLLKQYPELSKVKEFRQKHHDFSHDATSEEIHSWIKGADSTTLDRIISHPKLDASHVDAVLNDQHISADDKRGYIAHPHAQEHHIEAALKGEDRHLAVHALSNPKIQERHLHMALDHPHEDVAASAAANGRASPELLHKALDHKSSYVRQNALWNYASDASHVDKALKDKDADVRYTALSSSAAKPHHINSAINDPSHRIRDFVSKHNSLTGESIHKILDGDDENMQYNALNHSKFDNTHVEKLVKGGKNGLITRYLDYSPDVSEKTLTDLHNHEDENIRFGVAQHYNTPDSVRKTLTRDKSARVRAKNISYFDNADHMDLHRALSDSDPQVRQKAAHHRNLNSEHITKALNDEDMYVRGNVAEHHHKLTPEHIEKAMSDNFSFVRRQALRSDKVPDHVLKKAFSDIDDDIVHAAVTHPNNTAETLEHLINSNAKPQFKALAYGNKKLPTKHLDTITSSNDEEGVYRAAKNPNLSAKHISNLIKNKAMSSHMLDYLLNHENFNTSHIDDITNSHHSEDYKGVALTHQLATPEHLHKALDHEDYFYRRRALRHTNTNASHIEKAIKNESNTVRHEAAGHRLTTKAHLQQLENDDDVDVRDLVRHRLGSGDHM